MHKRKKRQIEPLTKSSKNNQFFAAVKLLSYYFFSFLFATKPKITTRKKKLALILKTLPFLKNVKIISQA